MKKLDFCKPTKSVTGSWITFGLTQEYDQIYLVWAQTGSNRRPTD